MLNSAPYRGRDNNAVLTWDMFPGKLESMNVYYDEELMKDYMVNKLKDYSTDRDALRPEELNRSTINTTKLNLVDCGARWKGDPYINPNYDLNDYYKDPSGWSGEYLWREHENEMYNKMRMKKFYDDGDYSVREKSWDPAHIHNAIRNMEQDFKSRWKFYKTSTHVDHPAARVKMYSRDHSLLDRMNGEDTSVVRNEVAPGRVFDHYELGTDRTHALSNLVHNGTNLIRNNGSTTDHKVDVAAYGMLHSNRGLIPRAIQQRIVAGDMKYNETWEKVASNSITMMKERCYPRIKSTKVGQRYHDSIVDNNKRSKKLTQDILNILGYTSYEIRACTSKLSKTSKHGPHNKMKLLQTLSYVDNLPMSEKINLKNTLLLGKQSRQGKTQDILNHVIINPKLSSHMENRIRQRQNKKLPRRDSKLTHQKIDSKTTPIFIQSHPKIDRRDKSFYDEVVKNDHEVINLRKRLKKYDIKKNRDDIIIDIEQDSIKQDVEPWPKPNNSCIGRRNVDIFVEGEDIDLVPHSKVKQPQRRQNRSVAKSYNGQNIEVSNGARRAKISRQVHAEIN